jgi:5-methylcytosine-specific restriction endonuclease McrA
MAKPFAIKFYKSKAWRTVRAQVLRRDHYSCVDCDCRASEVHHIIELTPDNIDNPDISLNMDNLESLCWDCHNKRTKKRIDVSELYEFNENGMVVPVSRQ